MNFEHCSISECINEYHTLVICLGEDLPLLTYLHWLHLHRLVVIFSNNLSCIDEVCVLCVRCAVRVRIASCERAVVLHSGRRASHPGDAADGDPGTSHLHLHHSLPGGGSHLHHAHLRRHLPDRRAPTGERRTLGPVSRPRRR